MDDNKHFDSTTHINDFLSRSQTDLRSLEAQMRGMTVLLRQNAALENEIKLLCEQLDKFTKGIQKKGYLYKWREREIYYASRWGLRYFILQGSQLSYYSDEHEQRPRHTFNLNSKCFVRAEGTKKHATYHIFSIYMEGEEEGGDDRLVIRLSSDNAADASLWIEALTQACHLKEIEEEENKISTQESTNFNASRTAGNYQDIDLTESSTTQVLQNDATNAGDEGDWGNYQGVEIELNDNSSKIFTEQMIKRVQSSSLVLQKSISRHNISSSALVNRSHLSQNNLMDGSSKSSKKKSLLNKSKEFPGYKPMHVSSAPSPLSSEVRPGEYNFRGFFNLGVIILAVSHCELIMNNISNHGVKVSLISFIRPPEAAVEMGNRSYDTSALLWHIGKAVSTWFVSILLNYSLERYTARNRISERVTLVLNYLIGLFNIIAPCYWVWTSHAHPGANLAYLFQSVILWMKLISYAHANKDLRVASRKVKKIDRDASNASVDDLAFANSSASQVTGEQYIKTVSEVKDLQLPFILYPQNLTLINLLYFCIAPTLCYQLNYPRVESINWRKVFSLVLRLLFVAFAIIFSVEQYISPTLETAFEPMNKGRYLAVLERLIKLSIPNTYVWLMTFYFYFHLWLNLLAELTCFGDRVFYKDWWNARTIDKYWRTWNMPVHHWITRHLYYPIIRMGLSKVFATFVAFFFSALMHEVVISMPFQHISFFAFSGMMAQAPLIFVAKYIDRVFDNSFLGNAFFWISFCVVGQPIAVLMYYYDLRKLSMGGTC